ncbi:hypothetical protein [Micromonospora chersina]|uniref:hypothetical protein n=1 Tax=Micromonospora chersina TaxID=47854 RepID=UPI0033F995E1
MGLFSKNPANVPKPDGEKMRGGCSSCDMRGPKRNTLRAANKDVLGHDKRMHGGKNPHGYIEGGH